MGLAYNPKGIIIFIFLITKYACMVSIIIKYLVFIMLFRYFVIVIGGSRNNILRHIVNSLAVIKEIRALGSSILIVDIFFEVSTRYFVVSRRTSGE